MSTSTKLCGLLALIAWLPLTIGYERPSVGLQPVVDTNLVGNLCDSCVALANDLQPAAPKGEKIDGGVKKTDGKARNEKSRLENPSEIKVGLASWYGGHHHGRRTASGEIFDETQFTTAHRTFDFGTWLCVRNVANGKSVRARVGNGDIVKVKVNDRGPARWTGRELDLSRAAFYKLTGGHLEYGVVEIEYWVCR